MIIKLKLLDVTLSYPIWNIFFPETHLFNDSNCMAFLQNDSLLIYFDYCEETLMDFNLYILDNGINKFVFRLTSYIGFNVDVSYFYYTTKS